MQLTINIANEELFDKILDNLETSVKEMQLIKDGKIKAINARNLLDEL